MTSTPLLLPAGVTTTKRERKRERKIRFQTVALLIILSLLTFGKAYHFWIFTSETFQGRINDTQNPILSSVRPDESFGACLIVKGDNDLLTEWIPYHYTLLPLRYLLVVSDEGNLEDPNDVLRKWRISNTDLKSWMVNVSIFENIHGEFNEEGTLSRYRKSKTYSKLQQQSNNNNNSTIDHEIQYLAHSRLIHKQKAMITVRTIYKIRCNINMDHLIDVLFFNVIACR
ncbi:MAG: hypothetical protein ACI8RD_001334 [Bacillariaceae sp.]|jgi:hypothetical protein